MFTVVDHRYSDVTHIT